LENTEKDTRSFLEKEEVVKMMKRSVVIIALLLSVALVLGSENQSSADSQQTKQNTKVITLRLSHTSPKDHKNYYSRYSDKFAELAAKYTGGRLQVKTFGEGELYGSYIEMAKAVMEGALNMGFIIPSTAYPQAGIPEAAAPMIPRLLKTEEAYYEFLSRPDGYGVIDQLAADKGVKRLDSVIFGKYYLYTPKEINEPADFQGLIMRYGGGAIDIAGKALGTTPSPLTISEVYSGLQQGVIDGAATGLDGFSRRKWYEVAPYVVAKNWMFTWYNVDLIINQNTWAKLPQDLQEIVEEKVIPELHEWAVAEAHAEWEKAEKDVEAVGGKWVIFTPEVVTQLDKMISTKGYPEIKAISPTMKKLIEVAESLEK
jgi:TRAP-type C4-dicarboxylate transport system substrate-binding protein